MSPKNALFSEVGGNGLFGSVNYERRIIPSSQIYLRIGAGFYTEKGIYLSLPVGLNYLIKLNRRNSFVEAGIGVSRAQAIKHGANSVGNNFFSYVPSICYRRYTDRDYMWRISFTPITNRYVFVPWVGVSVGKAL